jgi:hypothetical protein
MDFFGSFVFATNFFFFLSSKSWRELEIRETWTEASEEKLTITITLAGPQKWLV